MTMLRERTTMEVTRTPERSHFTEVVTGIVGLVAAAVGAWMYYVPADWFLGGLAEGYHFGFFTGAGVLLAGAFGLYARTVYDDDRGWSTRAVVGTVLALLALAGAVTAVTILII